MKKTFVFLFLAASLSEALTNVTDAVFSTEKLTEIIETNHLTKLDDVIGLLPESMRLNFTLKHGIKRTGERGHLFETKVSQSSDPDQPRAILWDERNGYTISYNGGAEKQTNPHRLDILKFEPKSKTFLLEDIVFQAQGGDSKVHRNDCTECHGKNNRPIFAMYPDWPSFYGSDNDELTGVTADQKAEMKDYKNFLSTNAHSPRYQPLFDPQLIRTHYKTEMTSSYPYRPDTSTDPQAVSRAFAYRPGLRLGMIYNRQMAFHVTDKLKSSPAFNELKEFTLFSLMNCKWEKSSALARTQVLKSVEKTLQSKPLILPSGRLDNFQLWQLYGLKINDVDLRYSYNHEGYKNRDANKNVMAVGYIDDYFNAYFDGSATIDELVSYQLLLELAQTDNSYAKTITSHGLTEKYEKFKARFVLDRDFFARMDQTSRWVPIPYSMKIRDVHHREGWGPIFQAQHDKSCGFLNQKLRDKFK